MREGIEWFVLKTKNQKTKKKNPATYSGLEEDEEQAVLLSDPEKKF